jgi:hypothetical protein
MIRIVPQNGPDGFTGYEVVITWKTSDSELAEIFAEVAARYVLVTHLGLGILRMPSVYGSYLLKHSRRNRLHLRHTLLKEAQVLQHYLDAMLAPGLAEPSIELRRLIADYPSLRDLVPTSEQVRVEQTFMRLRQRRRARAVNQRSLLQTG